MKRIVITIDGPAGAGKTTVSRMLADRLGYKYVDTGALYRAVALHAFRGGVDSGDDAGLEAICKDLVLTFQRTEKGLRLFAGGEDITDLIRTPEITMKASAVSARPVVRRYLLAVQREMGRQKGVVLEGRDMGTVVFPEAEAKFFLDASVTARAKRRFEEMKSTSSQTLEEVERDIRQRDQNDSTRTVAPLKPAGDAVSVDSTRYSPLQVVDLMLEHVERRLRI